MISSGKLPNDCLSFVCHSVTHTHAHMAIHTPAEFDQIIENDGTPRASTRTRMYDCVYEPDDGDSKCTDTRGNEIIVIRAEDVIFFTTVFCCFIIIHIYLLHLFFLFFHMMKLSRDNADKTDERTALELR